MTDLTPPCYGLHLLFDSTDYQDHLAAKEYCGSCPLIEACSAELEGAIADSTSGGRPEGTWAGRFLASERITDRRTPRRIENDDERYSKEEAKAAYSQYRAGRRSSWIETGYRVHMARRKREERAAKKAA